MSIIFRVGQMIMLVMMSLWLLFGAGLTWVSMKAERDIRSSDSGSMSNSMSDSEDSYRPSYNDEYDRERRREREGINIDTDSARPMVDVGPSR